MVPGDPSSAAFLAAAALIVPGSEITIEGVLVNPTRTGFYTTLREMGADVAFLNEREEGGEPVADIRVRHSQAQGRARAAGARAEHDRRISRCWPVVAAYADGETRMEGLAELKVKESDRLAATAAGLAANGVAAKVEGDTLIVQGGDGRARRRHGRHPPRPPHRHGLPDAGPRRRPAGHGRRRRHDRHQLPRVPSR